ncbi:MAG: hypothetical protein JWN64_350 [Parcubacteria group bacterium]|nr:hypothetical protein [Parcubacteria group bacterium]
MESPTPDIAELKDLLEENIEIAKENNRLLKLIRRDAVLGLVAKILLWLIILGVPIFFLSAYIQPLMALFSGQQASPAGFGVPSKEQIDVLIKEYQAAYGNK